jgi:hypothetical protein
MPAAVLISQQVAFSEAIGTRTTGPLSSLTNQTNGLSIQRYPQDLGGTNGNNTKNHWVTFTVYDVEVAKYDAQSVLTIGNKAFGLAAVVGAGAGVAALQGSKTVVGGVSAVVGAAGSAVIAGELLNSGTLKFNPQLTLPKSVISLYMPDTLNANYNASYDEMSLTKDLGQTVQTLRAIDSSLKTGTNFNFDEIKGNNLGSDPGTIQAATNILSNLGGGVNFENIGSLLLKAQGYALNPQVQMIYRGTGLRTFQLTFTFTPKSQNEADTVNSIINQFRFYSSPSLSSAGNPTGSMFLVPPSQFDIQFFVNGQESNVLPKYGKCVLTSIDINDSPNGFAVYDDGSMVQRQVNLSFKELDMLTRDYFTNDTTSYVVGSVIDTRR